MFNLSDIDDSGFELVYTPDLCSTDWELWCETYAEHKLYLFLCASARLYGNGAQNLDLSGSIRWKSSRSTRSSGRGQRHRWGWMIPRTGDRKTWTFQCYVLTQTFIEMSGGIPRYTTEITHFPYSHVMTLRRSTDSRFWNRLLGEDVEFVTFHCGAPSCIAL